MSNKSRTIWFTTLGAGIGAVALLVLLAWWFRAGVVVEPDSGCANSQSNGLATGPEEESVPADPVPPVTREARVVSIPPGEYYVWGSICASKAPPRADTAGFQSFGLLFREKRTVQGEALLAPDEILTAHNARDWNTLFYWGQVLPELEGVEILYPSIMGRRGLEQLAFWPNLRYLSLGGGRDEVGFGRQSDLEALQGIKSLTHLHFRGGLTTEGFLHLTKLHGLEYLDIVVAGVGDDGHDLRHLRNLRQLKVWGIRHSGPWIESLASMHDLQVLTINAMYGFSDDAYDQLAALPRLRVLYLSSSSGITAAQAARLSKSASLRELCLWSGSAVQDELTADTLRILQPLGLRALRLPFYKHLTDDIFDALAEYDSLEHLDLARCTGLTGAGLIDVARLPKLHTLNLNGCENIAMEHVQALKEIDRPLHVDLRGCKHVTYLGARDLMDANPNLTIVADRFR